MFVLGVHQVLFYTLSLYLFSKTSIVLMCNYFTVDGMNEINHTTLGMITLTDAKDNVMFNYTDFFSANSVGVWPGISTAIVV